MKKSVHVWHLHLTEDIKERGPAVSPSKTAAYELKQVDAPLPEFNRFLYVAVGAPWQWYMRLSWTYAEWQQFLKNPNTQTWVAYLNGMPIGYFELEAQTNQSCEICYFGLFTEYIGQGFGRSLLEDAINCAWQLGGERVWLHTCTLDHPQALPNYLARGFKIFKEEDIDEEIPDEAIQPWPGAGKSPYIDNV